MQHNLHRVSISITYLKDRLSGPKAYASKEPKLYPFRYSSKLCLIDTPDTPDIIFDWHFRICQDECCMAGIQAFLVTGHPSSQFYSDFRRSLLDVHPSISRVEARLVRSASHTSSAELLKAYFTQKVFRPAQYNMHPESIHFFAR